MSSASVWRSKFFGLVTYGILLSACLAGVTASLRAEEAPLTVQAEVDKGIITIGELTQYTVTIRHKSAIHISAPVQFPNPRDFSVKSEETSPRKEENGFVTERHKFSITAYGLGDFVIEEVPIRYLDEKGEEQTLKTNRLYVSVESVDKSGNPKADIRGLKQSWYLKSQIKKWLAAGGGAFFILILVFFLWKHWRQIKKSITPQETPLLPHEEAIRDLQRLFESALIRDGKVKEYYDRLSEILKIYLEKRFLFQTTEKTTEEITKGMKELTIDDGARLNIRNLLQEADIVKFAVYFPPHSEILRINQAALAIIEKTKQTEADLSPDVSEFKTPEGKKAC